MSLVDPHALIGATLGLEAAELQGNVGRVLEHHVTSGSRTSDILEDLAHQAITTSWIGRVDNLHLLL